VRQVPSVLINKTSAPSCRHGQTVCRAPSGSGGQGIKRPASCSNSICFHGSMVGDAGDTELSGTQPGFQVAPGGDTSTDRPYAQGWDRREAQSKQGPRLGLREGLQRWETSELEARRTRALGRMSRRWKQWWGLGPEGMLPSAEVRLKCLLAAWLVGCRLYLKVEGSHGRF
jgi:hypothetical protein